MARPPQEKRMKLTVFAVTQNCLAVVRASLAFARQSIAPVNGEQVTVFFLAIARASPCVQVLIAHQPDRANKEEKHKKNCVYRAGDGLGRLNLARLQILDVMGMVQTVCRLLDRAGSPAVGCAPRRAPTPEDRCSAFAWSIAC